MDLSLNLGHLITGTISLFAVIVAYLSYRNNKKNKIDDQACHLQTDVIILKTKVESMEKFLEKLDSKLSDIRDSL